MNCCPLREGLNNRTALTTGIHSLPVLSSAFSTLLGDLTRILRALLLPLDLSGVIGRQLAWPIYQFQACSILPAWTVLIPVETAYIVAAYMMHLFQPILVLWSGKFGLLELAAQQSRYMGDVFGTDQHKMAHIFQKDFHSITFVRSWNPRIVLVPPTDINIFPGCSTRPDSQCLLRRIIFPLNSTIHHKLTKNPVLSLCF